MCPRTRPCKSATWRALSYSRLSPVKRWGEILACRDEGPGVVLAEIDHARLAAVRESLPALRHRCLA